MSRKRKGTPDLLEALLPAVGVLAVLFYLSGKTPGGREALTKGLRPVVWGFAFVVLVYVVVRVIRHSRVGSDRAQGSQPRADSGDRGVAEDVRVQHVSRPAFAPRPTSPQVVAPVQVTRVVVPPRRPAEPSLDDQLRAIDWFQFEKVVALVYEARGHRVTRRGGANPDGGVDLLAEKDGRRSAIQC